MIWNMYGTRLSNCDLKVFTKLYEETVIDSTRISKDAFLSCIGKEPGQTDLSGLYPMENKEFLYALYENLFYRMPDPTSEKRWETEAEKLEKEEFRRKLVSQLLKSDEYRMKNFRCSHNIYAPFFTGAELAGNRYLKEEIKVKIKAVARKLPFGIYGRLKALLGR